MSSRIKVTKRNGSIEDLNLEKLHNMVGEACKGLSGVSASQVEMASGIQFYDGITTSEIQEILIKSASDLISLENTNYQFVAARLLLFSIRKSIYGGRIDMPHLEDQINSCISLGLYDNEIYNHYSKEEIDKANSYIDHGRDYLFTYAGLRQVVDKYLIQDRSNGNLYECPQFMYIMISLVIFSRYPKETRMGYVKKYYDAISKHKINIPTPIMAGVRTQLKQFASCTLLSCGDSLESIIATDGAMIRYIAGRAGIGLNVGSIRGIGSKIRNGEVISTGLIPFLKKFQSSLESCHQGGIRKASMTAYVPIWHQEIESVLVLKNNKGNDENRVRNIDYGICISKIFYERFIKDGEITLFSPHDVPGLYDSFGTDLFDSLYVQYEKDSSIKKKTVKAQELILSLLNERNETGRIYIMNIDHSNSHSSFKDKIDMSNLCVAGDTKIRIKYPESVGDQYSTWYWNVLEKEIKIEDLEDYIIMRKCEMYDSNAPQIEVLSYDIETGEQRWAPITAFAETSPKAKVMRITDEESGKSIVVTPEHKVFTKNRGYVMAKDLNPNDQLVYVGKSHTVGTFLIIEYLEEEIPVYDITVEGTHNFFANNILVHNCLEITLPTTPLESLNDEYGEIALCVLSALNVGIIKSDKELEELCDLSVRSLDELIDYQNYPVKAAEISTKARRSLGIGVIGLAHYFAKLGYSYEDQEAWNAAHGLAESLQYFLLKSSNQLAKEKGHCEYFGRTKYSDGILPIDTYKKEVDGICSSSLQHDWEELRRNILQYGLRNSTLTAQMPSESSSLVSNATNGIEPPRDYLSIKRRIKQIVPQYSTLKNNYTLLWDMKSNDGYFNVVAVFQKFFDQSISTNWNYNPEHYPNKKVPMSVIVNDFLQAFKKGHKTAYYLNTYDGKKDDMKLEDLVNDVLGNAEEENCDSCAI